MQWFPSRGKFQTNISCLSVPGQQLTWDRIQVRSTERCISHQIGPLSVCWSVVLHLSLPNTNTTNTNTTVADSDRAHALRQAIHLTQFSQESQWCVTRLKILSEVIKGKCLYLVQLTCIGNDTVVYRTRINFEAKKIGVQNLTQHFKNHETWGMI